MDPIAKRTLAICVAIMVAPELASLTEQGAMAVKDVIYGAILKAEKIMKRVDERWPDNRITGKT